MRLHEVFLVPHKSMEDVRPTVCVLTVTQEHHSSRLMLCCECSLVCMCIVLVSHVYPWC